MRYLPSFRYELDTRRKRSLYHAGAGGTLRVRIGCRCAEAADQERAVRLSSSSATAYVAGAERSRHWLAPLELLASPQSRRTGIEVAADRNRARLSPRLHRTRSDVAPRR